MQLLYLISSGQKSESERNTASLLEMESGSNDPVSYMLTVILTEVLTGQSVNVGSMLVFQILFGIGCGVFLEKSQRLF